MRHFLHFVLDHLPMAVPVPYDAFQGFNHANPNDTTPWTVAFDPAENTVVLACEYLGIHVSQDEAADPPSDPLQAPGRDRRRSRVSAKFASIVRSSRHIIPSLHTRGPIGQM
ncbi:hypothetical protein M408DRAFT_196382 [Serendipita vermifera MAFF 305830]|uniref:Uncharacterized protein n=1 Tax=Serendipita vermifera MAFF 305830 TaxID=933852 RepID=A0A0C3B3R9_SERVB|nr:hypothetical protein M408DRAFT_196382 [Serendipita vermifera MAFF 305830]